MMASKPFDATLKELIEDDSASWPALVGDWPIKAVAVIDADVSTVSAAADKVLRIHGNSGNWLLDLEPESSHAEDIPERLHLYSTLLHRRHELPVHSVVLLLRREANARNLTGVLELRLPSCNEPYDVFRYQVIRLWEEPLARLLAGGLGTLALAPLTDEGSANLPEVLRVIDERLRQEAPPPRAAKIWAATFVLMGLRYPAELSEALFQGVMTMEESTTYQLIVKRGRIQEARTLLLRLGRTKFGVPADASMTAALERITDLEHLETLGERLLHVSSWQDLLSESPTS
jgi:predicted transposase YdaD